jgi:hypothetical protein
MKSSTYDKRAKCKEWKKANKERVKESYKKWVENNREKRRKINRKWRENNPTKKKAMNMRWQRNNPEKHRQSNHIYTRNDKGRIVGRNKCRRRYWLDPEYPRLKALSRIHGCDLGVLAAVKERDKFCKLCGYSKDLTFDHIFPVSLGGKTTEENLQRLCIRCNLFKLNHLFLPDGGMMRVGKKYGI